MINFTGKRPKSIGVRKKNYSVFFQNVFLKNLLIQLTILMIANQKLFCQP